MKHVIQLHPAEPATEQIVKVVLKPNLGGDYEVVSADVVDMYEMEVDSNGDNSVTLIYHTRPMVQVDLDLNVKLLNADAEGDEELPLPDPYTFHVALVSGNPADVAFQQTSTQNTAGGTPGLLRH